VFPRTKFHRALVREEHVERVRLLTTISASDAPIVVMTAPPGFGKSTLLAQCALATPDPERVVWVSLDGDDGGNRLFAAILTGLRDELGRVLDGALEAVDAPDIDLRQDVLITLLDALAAASEPVTLILDDLHLALRDEETRRHLDWVLKRLPPDLGHRVLISTRCDLELESVRCLRIRGQVLELRATDLRFTDEETPQFLCGSLGLELTAADIDRLQGQTEGWPAALYLAALRLRLGDDLDTVAEQLTGHNEELFGALTDEVLRATPGRERQFILELAVLDRFNADLCARVLGDERTTRAAFRRLTRTSLLLIPLDRGRTWFRLHHVLRDVLRARLVAEDPERARGLHVRAGAWFESEGGESELHEAMRHYLTAGEWDLAAELLARHSMRFVQSGALGGRARDWLARFPPEVIQHDARLAYVSAVLAALDGDRLARDAWLSTAEEAGWDGPMPDGTESLRLSALCLSAMLCFDDVEGALAAAAAALDVLPMASPMRSACRALSGWHAWLLGHHEEAEVHARAALVVPPGLSRATLLPLVAYLPSAVLALVALDRGEVAAAASLVAAAVDARDNGPLRRAPHTLPVTCAAARLATLSGRPTDAVERCRQGLELALEWRDSSLMVPAALLELARAHASLGEDERAAQVAGAGLARVLGAPSAGTLASDLAQLEARPGRDALVGCEAHDEAEALSSREIEVLRALAGTGSLREVADALYISRNTIKTHTRALYAKLGVGTREDAVRRGRERGLLHGDGFPISRDGFPTSREGLPAMPR
jgi:LuxR family maltose regulon positive regulatory protein